MSFLRWAGSKRQLLDVLACCWHAAGDPPHPKRYIEGFSGSASLFFYVCPEDAILVDVNKELQECLKQVQLSPKGVSLALSLLKSNEEDYYKIRALDRSKLSRNQRAAVFIYLNRNCFNGLYRTNLQGQFNVPFGGHSKVGGLPTYTQLRDFSFKLQTADIVTGDFFDVLAPRLQAGDFLYLDPPYAKRNVGLDNQYGPDVFGMRDLDRLENLVEIADQRGATFLVSYANCDEITPFASRWSSHTVEVRRTIAANVNKRGFAEELLITNL